MANPTSYPDTDNDLDPEPGRDSPPGIPGWVKLFGLVALALLLLLAILIFSDAGGGSHGPGRHQSGIYVMAANAATGFVTLGSAHRPADPAPQIRGGSYR